MKEFQENNATLTPLTLSPACGRGIIRIDRRVYNFARSDVMAEAVLKIKQWGNDLGIRLPAAVVREAHLHVGQRVRMSVERTQVVLTPIIDSQLTLEQRLAAFDPVRHSGERRRAPELT